MKEKHDWPLCNYAHRLQDFRRPPQNFFYRPEWCPNIQLDETFADCPDGIDCPKCHNLMELLFNPFYYKKHDCLSDHIPDDEFSCNEKGRICAYKHS
jgi:hypothetical protein